MAASTATTIHVAGPIIPTSNMGSGLTQYIMGECQDGATITIMPKTHEVKADGGGGLDGEAIEHIFLNAVAEIRFKLVPYSGTYLNALRALALASAVDGQLVLPGTLYGAGGKLPSLYIPLIGGTGANEPDGPYYFPYCKVMVPGNVNVWVKETTPEMVFRAMVWYDPSAVTSVSGRTLYTRAAPA